MHSLYSPAQYRFSLFTITAFSKKWILDDDALYKEFKYNWYCFQVKFKKKSLDLWEKGDGRNTHFLY